MLSVLLTVVALFLALPFHYALVQSAFRRGSSRTLLWNALTPLTANGKRFEAQPGTSMMAACLKLGLKVPTDCRKGECGACTVTVAGQKIRACVGKVPPAPRLKSLVEKGLAVTVDN